MTVLEAVLIVALLILGFVGARAIAHVVTRLGRRIPFLDPIFRFEWVAERWFDRFLGRPTVDPDTYYEGVGELKGHMAQVRRSFWSVGDHAEGTVIVRGEIWRAISAGGADRLSRGSPCRVLRVEGSLLWVERVDS